MTTTYTVTRGQQYDPDGASVEFGNLSANFRADGRFQNGDFPGVEGLAAVKDAVARVIATGHAETISVGAPARHATAAETQAMDRHDRLMADMDRADSDH